MKTDLLDNTISDILQDNPAAEYVEPRENPIALREKDSGQKTDPQDSVKQDAIRLFNSDLGFKVRVIMRAGDPWFVAKDVCEALGLEQVSRACDRLDDDEKANLTKSNVGENTGLYDFSNGGRSPIIVSEPGLYSLIGSSKKPEAKAFKRWVNHEVLPSIRKTGGYSIAQPTVPSYMLASEEERAIAWAEEHRQARLALEAKEREIEALEVERDEAIRTKHHFVEGRDAKVCGELGGLRTQNEALRKQIGDAKKYKAVTAISWLPDYFDISNRGLYGSLAAKLKKLEAEMPREFAHTDIPDSRYGTVKAYHVGVIERLHEMVQADETLMAKYRKIASV